MYTYIGTVPSTYSHPIPIPTLEAYPGQSDYGL